MPATSRTGGKGQAGRAPDQRLVASGGGGVPGPGAPRRERLGRGRRLTRSGDFQQAYAQGRRWDGRTMVLWLRSGEGASLRLGVVSSRRVGGAVQRNRARRLLREAYRRNRHRMAGEVDVVLIARRAILDAKWPEIVEDLLGLVRRAGLLKEEDLKPET